MLRSVTCIAVLAVTIGALSVPAESRSRKQVRSAEPPVKDCTRINGRWGYYGNPWCSRAEQYRWDRFEARRIAR